MIEIHLLAYYLGIFALFSSSAYILVKADSPMSRRFAYINLVAGLLIAYFFMHQQGYLAY